MLQHFPIASADGDEVGPRLAQRHLVAERPLIQTVADKGVVFPEANGADQAHAAFGERDEATAGALLARRLVLRDIPGHNPPNIRFDRIIWVYNYQFFSV